MASIYLARMAGTAGFSRTVAIKRLHPGYATDPDFVSMFVDEARLASRIAHPNVVPTIDVGSAEGELFLVMEYVQGESLAWLLRQAAASAVRPPVPVTAAILCNVLDGLHAAHEARSERGELLGLVHRDVSPHNILIGADGVARLIDLGVAKAEVRVATTREGQLKGKLGYMAPEHVRGSATRASDIYSAGIVFWEALTVRRAFQASNEGELLDQVLTATVAPPSQHVPDLSPAVDAIVAKALSRSPAARFATARAMARAIEADVSIASAAEVGDWVQGLAGEQLVVHKGRIAQLEREEDSNAPAPAAATPQRESTGTAVTKSERSATGPSASRGRWPTRSILLGLGVLGVTAATAVVFRPRGTTAGAVPAAEASVLPAPSTPPAPAPPPADPAPVAPPAATSAAPALPAASAPVPVPPRRRGHPASKPSCDPPYTFDDQGIKHYKRECSP
jgi:serine/threonine-protein kinase